MSFGTVLGELCSLCGIKRCNLADALGYDPSYISRWINNVKLPAADSHGELFRRMGEYMASAAAPSLRERAIARFSLPCTAEEAEFSAAVAGLLYSAYEETKQLTAPRRQHTGSENATLTLATGSSLFPESIFQVLRSRSIPGKPVELICTNPIHGQFKNNEAFFRRLRESVPPNTPIRVIQFVDMDDIAAKVNHSCRSFCYLMGQPYDIHYDFYELKASGQSFLVRDELLIQYLREPVTGNLLLLESFDSELIRRYCSSADRYILNRPSVSKPANMQKLRKNQYFLDYFMQPDCRCLLKHMQPLYFPESLQERLTPRERDIGRNMGLYLDGSRFFESVILYKSALVDYVYTGKLRAFGRTVEIPRSDRMTHLQNMLDVLDGNRSGQLNILSTHNQICNHDDLPTSMFLSRNAAFALQHKESTDRVLYTLSSRKMIGHMNTWLDHLQTLPNDQCLSGTDAIDYIARCIKLL
ncbi:MAG: hypothetical protein IJA67_03545 [Oscillospiraceae bacterium]|nr:hypothetical protein [Oscillospiraceae bacterium]